MRKLVFISTILLITKLSVAQTVSVDSAKYFEGKTITVCSKVVGTHVSNGDKKNVNLNFAKPYPETPFSVYIKEEDAVKFKNSPAEFYMNKNVCVTGVIKIFKDKPEIVVTTEDQLKIK